jgi:prolipoprotein diacylglyceryl transferase
MARPLAYIPSPSINSFHIGPLEIHFYALMYLVGIALAIIITRRRYSAVGGNPDLVGDVALWAVPAGIIGGRIYFDVTTPMDIPHVWYGVFAVWDGGLGIWGGIALAAVVGLWRIRKAGADGGLFMDAVAPALLVAQGIGRIGNYFNKELFGGPTTLPWGLEIPLQYRPAGYLQYATFHPTFLYELIWDFLLAAALVWLGHHRGIKAPGLFALYVAGYSAFRIFEESLRVDSSVHILGLRLNMYVAIILTIVGLVWFYRSQRRPAVQPAGPADATGSSATDGTAQATDLADGQSTDATTSQPIDPADARATAEGAVPKEQNAEGENADGRNTEDRNTEDWNTEDRSAAEVADGRP